MTVKALLVALVALQLSGTLAVSPAQPSLETQSQQEGLFALNDDCLQCIETKQSVNQRSAACDACAIAVGAQGSLVCTSVQALASVQPRACRTCFAAQIANKTLCLSCLLQGVNPQSCITCGAFPTSQFQAACTKASILAAAGALKLKLKAAAKVSATLSLLLPGTANGKAANVSQHRRQLSRARGLNDSRGGASQVHTPAEWYPKPLFPSAFTPGKRPGRLHWVVVSCDRPQMGRYLSTALLTGLSNGLDAATVSILWCHTMAHMRENKKKLPDLLYNIRHGENAHMFFPSESLFNHAHEWHEHRVHLSAMLMSAVWGDTSLPILVTEEDIAFAPHAGKRLQHILSAIPHKHKPLTLSLYNSSNNDIFEVKTPQDVDDAQSMGDDLPVLDPSFDGKENHVNVTAYNATGHVTFLHYEFGTQGLFYNPPMVSLLSRMWTKILLSPPNFKWYALPATQYRAPDLHLSDMLYKILRCSADVYNGTSNCYFVRAGPSLVQHIGTKSLTQGAGNVQNSRFHIARDFPVRVAWPAYASEITW